MKFLKTLTLLWVQGPEDYLEVILARAECLRRRHTPELTQQLREFFGHATQLMASYFPDFLDRSLCLPSMWAHCETRAAGDPAAARQVWEGVLKTPSSR